MPHRLPTALAQIKVHKNKNKNTVHGKIQKSNTKTNLKYLCQIEIINLNYLMDHILLQGYFQCIIK